MPPNRNLSLGVDLKNRHRRGAYCSYAYYMATFLMEVPFIAGTSIVFCSIIYW